MVRKNDPQREIRKIAIDILQAGNYLESGHKPRAMKNIQNNITSLRRVVAMIKRG